MRRPTGLPVDTQREHGQVLRVVGERAGEERPVGLDRDRRRSGEIGADDGGLDLRPGGRRIAEAPERLRRPRELEVLGDRNGLPGVGEQRRKRGDVVALVPAG